jgi:hypothetical protein
MLKLKKGEKFEDRMKKLQIPESNWDKIREGYYKTGELKKPRKTKKEGE